MRFSLVAAVAAVATLSGCVATVPGATVPAAPVVVTPARPGTTVVTPPTPGATVVVTPAPTVKTVDAGSARSVISAELAKRAPGRNVGPLTDCVVANASQAELADIAAMQGKPAAANAVATIVSKPATTQCISRAIA